MRRVVKSVPTMTTTPSQTPNKSEFIRSQPAELTASQIVAKGKSVGLKFDDNYVHKIRGRAKKGKGARRRSAGAKRRAVRAIPTATARVSGGTPPARVSTSAETLLKAIAAELGLGLALEILTAERARVKALLRG